ncbi:uncharacterized protein Dwil_GK19206 [Drosophila willistoni]|uniref:snRNA-activating protein complex subunit 1 n=1 Tax=Drosophila willistoni TaxID=7260 RepID=B4NBB1_DROWI|nr:uncharacterized protein LOC6647244 [Drosophila willistoni]EDW81075.1 uncharacterized protein Dwil_GK19206 [Drosophila willistoni]
MELNVYHDCWQLVQRFHRLAEELQHAEFELFCRCWRELQMQHIYSAQTNHIEVVSTTLSALHVGKRVACSCRPNGQEFQASRAQRYAGIYLLYVIYNKQPTQNFAKIEVSPSTWDTLTRYFRELEKEENPRKDTMQACYIFTNLYQHQAFRFTALDYAQGLDNLISYDRLESIVGSKGYKQPIRPAHGQIGLEEDLNELRDLYRASGPFCQLEVAYNKQKHELAKHNNGALPPTQIFSQLRETFDEISHLLGDQNEEPCSSSAISQSVGQGVVRQRVRHKAMYGAEDAKTESSLENSDDLSQTMLAQRRMSSATIFVRQLPMEVAQEYQRGEDSDDEEADS